MILHYPIQVLVKCKAQLENNIELMTRRMNEYGHLTEYHLQNYKSRLDFQIELTQVNEAIRILTNDNLSKLSDCNQPYSQ